MAFGSPLFSPAPLGLSHRHPFVPSRRLRLLIRANFAAMGINALRVVRPAVVNPISKLTYFQILCTPHTNFTELYVTARGLHCEAFLHPSAFSAIPLGKTHDQVNLANRTGFEASYFRSPASGAPVVPPPVPVRAVRGVPIRRPSSSHTGLPAAKRGFKHIARTVSALRWTMQGLKPRLLCHEVTSQRCPEQLWGDLAARGQYGHKM